MNLEVPFKSSKPGRKWFYSFLKRHPIVKQKLAEYINRARASVTEHKIRDWFTEVQNLFKDDFYVFQHPCRVWNMDEIAFFFSPKGCLILAEKGKATYVQLTSTSEKDNVTTLLTVNAIGELAPPLTIFKYDRLSRSYILHHQTGELVKVIVDGCKRTTSTNTLPIYLNPSWKEMKLRSQTTGLYPFDPENVNYTKCISGKTPNAANSNEKIFDIHTVRNSIPVIEPTSKETNKSNKITVCALVHEPKLEVESCKQDNNTKKYKESSANNDVINKKKTIVIEEGIQAVNFTAEEIKEDVQTESTIVCQNKSVCKETERKPTDPRLGKEQN
ncbi:hypothetical protein QE152_g35814 [Popillia japonica]|uniref:Uncharacterized protein n=1 Tax=Popillia japonica TaxID=7064 RepID=A0AAW1IF49_POPJA